jgi:hypothetical protein
LLKDKPQLMVANGQNETTPTISTGPPREAVREKAGAGADGKTDADVRFERSTMVDTAGQMVRLIKGVTPMIKIEFDGDSLTEVQHAVGHMLQSIDHLKSVDIGHELSEWQVEDLHRNKPFTMRYRRAGRAETVIRPHSLFEMKRSVRYQRTRGRRLARLLGRGTSRAFLKAQGLFHSFQPSMSQREILRAEMLERLTERLAEMLKEKLRW